MSQAPPGYEEPRVSKPQPMEEEEEPELDISQVLVASLLNPNFILTNKFQMLPEEQGFIAFAGSGNRLDGKKKRTNSETEIQSR